MQSVCRKRVLSEGPVSGQGRGGAEKSEAWILAADTTARAQEGDELRGRDGRPAPNSENAVL